MIMTPAANDIRQIALTAMLFLGLSVSASTASEALGLRERIWVDTDAACGVSGRVDPDDCYALLYLLGRPDLEIVGISTVFGNAPLKETDRVTRSLVAAINPDVPVFAGAARAGDTAPSAASRALEAALESGPLTILALGPLSNLHTVFKDRPTLSGRVTRLVAMMGKKEGHLFHPSEGAEGGMLFGHGPVFRDFNFCKDIEAAMALVDLPVDTVLIPYEAARQVMLTGTDIQRFIAAGGQLGRVATASSDWLRFWRTSVGRDGFYPFDLVAAVYVAEPDYFSCASRAMRVDVDRRVYGPLPAPEALMVDPIGPAGAADVREATYCEHLAPGFHRHLRESMIGPRPS